MYPENPEVTQVIVGSMHMGYTSDTAWDRTHNLFRRKWEPIPLGHSDGRNNAALFRVASFLNHIPRWKNHSRITRESLANHSRITRESLANHSRITFDSLLNHSRITLESLANHSRITRESLANHSRITRESLANHP